MDLAETAFNGGIIGGGSFDEQKDFGVAMDGALPPVGAVDGELLDAGGEAGIEEGAGKTVGGGGVGDGGQDDRQGRFRGLRRLVVLRIHGSGEGRGAAARVLLTIRTS